MHRVALHRKLVLEHYCQVPMTQRGQIEPPAINKQEKGANEWLELAPGRDDPDIGRGVAIHEESRGGWRGDLRELARLLPLPLTGIFTGVPCRPVCMLSIGASVRVVRFEAGAVRWRARNGGEVAFHDAP